MSERAGMSTPRQPWRGYREAARRVHGDDVRRWFLNLFSRSGAGLSMSWRAWSESEVAVALPTESLAGAAMQRMCRKVICRHMERLCAYYGHCSPVEYPPAATRLLARI
jgi:hypothetical protein